MPFITLYVSKICEGAVFFLFYETESGNWLEVIFFKELLFVTPYIGWETTKPLKVYGQ